MEDPAKPHDESSATKTKVERIISTLILINRHVYDFKKRKEKNNISAIIIKLGFGYIY